jgi:hypothetical protein
VDRVHGVVDQWRHGPWWTMDRGATRARLSTSSPALWGSAPCRDGTGSKRADEDITPMDTNNTPQVGCSDQDGSPNRFDFVSVSDSRNSPY